jgi:hypothetical protein
LIRLEDTSAETDTDNDGDPDSPFAQGLGRVGVLLDGGVGAFNGDITINSGTASRIEVDGVGSAGIRLNAMLNGDLTSSGAITVVGDDSVGVDINGGVTGDVLLEGPINVLGENATGVDISGAVGGEVRMRGSVVATGFRYTTVLPSGVTLEELDADDKLIGGPALAVRADVAGGVILDGVGVENDDDDDGDGILEPGSVDGDTDTDTDDNNHVASLTSLGSAPAVLITTNGANVTLGPSEFDNFGFVNRGGVTASGLYDNIEATAVRIVGAGGSQVAIAGGILNDGVISASAREADSTAIYVGPDANAALILNRNRITSLSTSEAADTAYGVRVAAGAGVAEFQNSGSLEVQIAGDEGRSVAFIDESGGVATILNTGTIFASADSGSADFTGEVVAIDVSANTTGVTLTQSPSVAFPDDDATDDAPGPAVQIIGDIRFGSGNDTMAVLAGQTVGAIAFGGGADQLVIDGGALVAARLSDSDGLLSINVQDGTLAVDGSGAVDITTATFGADSTLVVELSSAAAESTLLRASGAVTFEQNALVRPVLVEGLPEDNTVVFLEAASLVGGENVARVLTGEANVPWVYNVEIAVSDSNPNALEASYSLKTVTQLFGDGVNQQNQRAAFDPVIAALRQDEAAEVAFGVLDTEPEFMEAYNSLLPNFSAATAELAITAIAEGQGATSNRLATARMNKLDNDSAWIQEIGFVVQRDAQEFGVDYEGHGFGFAAGFDGPLAEGLLLGLSVAFTTTEAEEDAREGNVTAAIGQLNAYFGGGLGPLEWDLVGGGGIGRMQSRREIRIGSDFDATTEADWMMYESHAQAQLGLPLRLGDRFTIKPRASIVYVGLNEEAYEEEGGGAAIDVAVGETSLQRVWADGVVDLSWRLGGATGVTPRLSFGYRTNIVDDPVERDVHFVSGGSSSSFTLMDEVLGEGGPLVGFSLTGGNEHSTISLMYEGEFTDTIDRHSINASLRVRF